MKEFSTMSSSLIKLLVFFYIFFFVNWVRVYIEDHTLTTIDFIDRLFVK